ncbi:ABC transporter ATP-binding protein, partial [Candidatus Dojkabacteria bacterium CG_4_10_14_3_um_filter_Dojkabacteria_WS6_41_9]
QSSNSSINYESIRRVLSNLGFPFESNINVLAGSLSGGETARLAFAMAASTSIDLLILDEPTNNLDIETIATIIESLRAFQGTLIVVSHDIHFLQQVAIDRVYAITNNKLAVSSFDNLISSI